MFTRRSIRVFFYFFVSFVVFRVLAVTLTDPQTSFLQFKGSNASENEGVHFCFKTFLTDALLLYMEDQGKTDFLRIDLFQGKLRLMFSFGSKLGEHSVYIGENLNDLEWHNVSLQRRKGNITIYLNGHRSKSIVSKHWKTGFNAKHFIYIGGIPPSLSVKNIAQPSVRRLKRFIGCMEDIRTTTIPLEGGTTIEAPLSVINSSAVSPGCIDMCSVGNPCGNHGRCMNRFVTAECDCTGSGYTGTVCEQALPVVGLYKSDYLIYRRPGKGESTQTDKITLRFKTSKPDGVLLECGQGNDYLVLELKHGAVQMKWNLGSGELKVHLKGKLCNDDEWHSIRLERERRRVMLTIDGLFHLSKRFPGSFVSYNLNKGEGDVIIGGMVRTNFSLHSRSSGVHFEGCLQEVVFNGIDIVAGFIRRDNELFAGGSPRIGCLVVSPPTQTSIFSTASENIGLTSTLRRDQSGKTTQPQLTYGKTYKMSRSASSPVYSGDSETKCYDDDDCNDDRSGSGQTEESSGSRNQFEEIDESSGSEKERNEIPDLVTNRSSKKPIKNVPPSSSGIPTYERELIGEGDIPRIQCFHDDEDECDDVDGSAHISADESSTGSASASTRPSLNRNHNNVAFRNKLKKKVNAKKWSLVVGIVVVSLLIVAFVVFAVWWFRQQRNKLLEMYKNSPETDFQLDSTAV